VREEPQLMSRLVNQAGVDARIREEVEKRVTLRARFPTYPEVPLSLDSKKILNFAAEEAQDLGQRHIGPEYLLLGILRVDKCVAAEILRAQGVTLDSARKRIAKDSDAIILKPYRSVTAREILDSFLSALKKFRAAEISPFFAEDAQVGDFRGRAWIGRDNIDFESCFAPFATKNARAHVERAERGSSDTFVAIVLWDDVTVAADAARYMHRMTIVFGQEDGAWTILVLQVTPVATR
jgi:Clp amino terminal domain, pathogenicity island component